MEESKDCYVDVDFLYRNRRKRRKILVDGEYILLEEKEKEENILEKICPNIVKDVEKSRFRKNWSWKRVSVSDNLLSGKVSVSVLEN